MNIVTYLLLNQSEPIRWKQFFLGLIMKASKWFETASRIVLPSTVSHLLYWKSAGLKIAGLALLASKLSENKRKYTEFKFTILTKYSPKFLEDCEINIIGQSAQFFGQGVGKGINFFLVFSSNVKFRILWVLRGVLERGGKAECEIFKSFSDFVTVLFYLNHYSDLYDFWCNAWLKNVLHSAFFARYCFPEFWPPDSTPISIADP